SRRRHTRSDRDWSSDVCSSDLSTNLLDWQLVPNALSLSNGVLRLHDPGNYPRRFYRVAEQTLWRIPAPQRLQTPTRRPDGMLIRSEERRVGKEGRSGGGAEQ